MDDLIFFDKDKVIYKVTISEREIQNKFGFSKDTLIKIKRELIKNRVLQITHVRTVSTGKKFYKYDKALWAEKYKNYEDEYILYIKKTKRRELFIPSNIIYDKNLSYSEKLAIVWNFSLKEKVGHQPALRELERESGISTKTIKKACDKCPKAFENT